MEKSLFNKIFNNKLLCKDIFEKVIEIHNKLSTGSYKWSYIVENKPILLAAYNYTDEVKKYYFKYRYYNYVSSLRPYITSIFEIKQSISFVIRNGNMELLRFFNEIFDITNFISAPKYQNLLAIATKYGRLEIIEYLESIHQQWDYCYIFGESPFSGNLQLVQEMAEKAKRYDAKQREFADSLKKHLLMYKNIKDQFEISLRVAMNNAVVYGTIEIIEWLQSLGLKSNVIFNAQQLAIYAMTSSNAIAVNEWLVANGFDYQDIEHMKYLDSAAYHQKYDLVKWLHYNNKGWCTTKAMDDVAFHGDLDMLEWLHINRTEGCTTKAMDFAARSHLDVVKWLHYNRTEGCTANAMNNAASTSLEIVQWLHENRTEGCTTVALLRAITNNHFDIVKFLVENRREIGCTNEIFKNALLSSNMDIIEYLYNKFYSGAIAAEQQSPLFYSDVYIYRLVINNSKSLEILKWMLQHERRPLMVITDLINHARYNRLDNALDILCQYKRENNITDDLSFKNIKNAISGYIGYYFKNNK